VTKRRQAEPLPFPDDWIVSEKLEIEGKRYALVPGRRFKVKGSNKEYAFKHHVRRANDGEEWITGWGGRWKYEQWRSFHPSRVKWIAQKVDRPKGAREGE